MNKFCDVIREKRLSNGQLLRHVAAYVDIDQSILSKIEHGERKPTTENILKLAEILKLEYRELMIQYISERILLDYVNEPYFVEAIEITAKKVSLMGINTAE